MLDASAYSVQFCKPCRDGVLESGTVIAEFVSRLFARLPAALPTPPVSAAETAAATVTPGLTSPVDM